MWYASQSWTWVPLYLLLIGLLVMRYKGGKSLQSWVPLLGAMIAMGIAVGMSDYITSGILKHWVCRPRPSHSDLEPLLHLVRDYRGGQYGFPSSHAANTLCVATLFCLLHRSGRGERATAAQAIGYTALFVGYAALNCYSRMYLGVHYPSDIAVGALIGVAIAFACYFLWKRFVYLGKKQ